MTMRILAVIAIVVSITAINVNKASGEIAGNISWKKSYKYRIGANTDPYDVKVDDYGYYVSIVFVDDRTWLLKLDPRTGDTVLSKMYDGHPYALAIDKDNNYVIVATRGRYNIFIDAIITKIDSRTGNIIWQKVYGDKDVEDKLLDIAVLPNGDYIGVGLKETRSWSSGNIDKLWVVYIDSETGDTLYTRRYDDLAYTSIGYAVAVNKFGDVYVGGVLKGKKSYGPKDGFILKIDETTGKIIWKKIIGSIKDDNVYDIMLDPSNRLVGVGSTVDLQKNEYMGWIFILDTYKGKLLREHKFDGLEEVSETHFVRIAWNPQTESYAVAGYFKSKSDKNSKNILVILNIEPESFKIVWHKILENNKKESMIRAIDVDGRGRIIAAGFDINFSTSTWFIQFNGLGKNVFWLKTYASIQTIDQILKHGRAFFVLADTKEGLKLFHIEGNKGTTVANLFAKKGEYGEDFDLLTDNIAILASYKYRSNYKIETILRLLSLEWRNKSKTIQEMKFKNLSPLAVKKINDTLIILVGIDNISNILKVINLFLDKNQKVKSHSILQIPDIPEDIKSINIEIIPEKGLLVLWGETDNYEQYIRIYDYRKRKFVQNKALKDMEERMKILDVSRKNDQIIVLGSIWKGLDLFHVLIRLNLPEDSVDVLEIEPPDTIKGIDNIISQAKPVYINDSTYIISFVTPSENSKDDVLHVVEFDHNLKPKRDFIYGLVGNDMEISRIFLHGWIMYIVGDIRKGLYETVPYIMKIFFPLLNK